MTTTYPIPVAADAESFRGTVPGQLQQTDLLEQPELLMIDPDNVHMIRW